MESEDAEESKALADSLAMVISAGPRDQGADSKGATMDPSVSEQQIDRIFGVRITSVPAGRVE